MTEEPRTCGFSSGFCRPHPHSDVQRVLSPVKHLDTACLPLPPLIELLSRQPSSSTGLLLVYSSLQLLPLPPAPTSFTQQPEERCKPDHVIPLLNNYLPFQPSPLPSSRTALLLFLHQARSAPASGPLHMLPSLPRKSSRPPCLTPSPNSGLNSMPQPQKGLSWPPRGPPCYTSLGTY